MTLLTSVSTMATSGIDDVDATRLQSRRVVRIRDRLVIADSLDHLRRNPTSTRLLKARTTPPAFFRLGVGKSDMSSEEERLIHGHAKLAAFLTERGYVIGKARCTS
jgi:hypothetical protein